MENNIELRVRYGETDQMGYCYYGNYAQYFEIGRVEALRSLGLSYRDLEESGYMLPVSKYEVQFYAPAKYDDLLLVQTCITELKGPQITFTYFVYKEDSLIARGITSLVFVDKTSMKPIRPPQNFVDLIEPYVVESPNNTSL